MWMSQEESNSAPALDDPSSHKSEQRADTWFFNFAPWQLGKLFGSLKRSQAAARSQIRSLVQYIQRYNRIHWQQSCPAKAAAGGCQSAPCSGVCLQPVLASVRGAGAAQPILMAPAKARREARSTGQSPKAKTEAFDDFEAWGPKFPLNLNPGLCIMVHHLASETNFKVKTRPKSLKIYSSSWDFLQFRYTKCGLGQSWIGKMKWPIS